MRYLLMSSVVTLSLLLPGVLTAQEVTVETAAKVETAVTNETNTDVAVEAETAIEAEVAAETESSAVAPAAVVNLSTAPAVVGTVPEGKGQIVFFRPSKFVGGAIGFKVREGKTELGKLRSGWYFVQNVEPGTHEYTVHSEAKDVLTMEVEPGETYYVQGMITMGILAGRPNLSPSDKTTFDGMANKLKLVR